MLLRFILQLRKYYKATLIECCIMFDKRGKNQRGQIWVETVIYTLIALVMIGIVLSVVKPRIEESQDKAIIEQSMNLIGDINSIILDIKRASGNQRIVELGIKKGILRIDGVEDKIIFEIESRYEYSEPGEEIIDDTTGIIINTKKMGEFNNVILTKDYHEDYNLTYEGENKIKSITKSSTPYELSISNKGEEEDKIIIDMRIT